MLVFIPHSKSTLFSCQHKTVLPENVCFDVLVSDQEFFDVLNHFKSDLIPMCQWGDSTTWNFVGDKHDTLRKRSGCPCQRAAQTPHLQNSTN